MTDRKISVGQRYPSSFTDTRETNRALATTGLYSDIARGARVAGIDKAVARTEAVKLVRHQAVTTTRLRRRGERHHRIAEPDLDAASRLRAKAVLASAPANHADADVVRLDRPRRRLRRREGGDGAAE